MKLSEEEKIRIEEELLQYPLAEYHYLEISDIKFYDRVRYICQTECPRYGSSYACPPAVGTLEECKAKCEQYDEAFLFTTMVEVHDIANMEETLATRRDHEEITREVAAIFRNHGLNVQPLSTESCAICETCAYPDAPCRFPDKMFPCVESYGILVTELAEQCGMSFLNGANVVTWFSLILIRRN